MTDPAEGRALDGLQDLLDLEDIDPGLFRGAVSGQPGRRLFGGQVAAQALVAAERTTEAGSAAHSLHAYFLRPGRRHDVSHMTSLDHVMWFHNEVRLDDWLLYVKSPLAAGDMRGLAQGSIFHRDGGGRAHV